MFGCDRRHGETTVGRLLMIPLACHQAGQGAPRRPVGAEDLCHQAIFVDDAARAVMPPDPEIIQVGDAIWQRPQWRGLVQGAVRPGQR
jgi:hypothetical protein